MMIGIRNYLKSAYASVDAYLQRFPWIALVCVGVLCCAFLAAMPLATAFKIGEDEDFELCKATFALNGYRFYANVWNDQPLLHTFLVTKILHYFPANILGPRLLSVFFSVILLGSVFLIAKRLNGLWVATGTAVCVLVSPGFLELSSSCMLEIPALATSLVVIALLLSSRVLNARKLLLAGIVYGASLQMKFIGLVLLPLIGAILWWQCETDAQDGVIGRPALGVADGILPHWKGDNSRVRLFCRYSCTFLGACLCGFTAIALYLGGDSFWVQMRQSWDSHFTRTRSFRYGTPDDYPFGWIVLLRHWDTTLPALIGSVVCLLESRFKRIYLLPFCWLTLSILVFGTHRPWWSYYYVHTAVPLCWCAGVGWRAVIRRVAIARSIFLRMALAVVVVVSASWMLARVGLQISSARAGEQTHSALVLKVIERYKPLARFMFADEPIYNFHCGILAPPSIGLIAMKRFWSGDLSHEKINQELATIKPELILVRVTSVESPFADLLGRDYRIVYEDSRQRLYVSRSLDGRVQW